MESTPINFYEMHTLPLDGNSKGLEQQILPEGRRRTDSTSFVQENASMEGMFARLAESLVRAITTATQANVGNNAYHERPRGPNVEFHGLDHEDPESFIRQMEDYFHRARMTHDSDNFYCITAQLKGEARKWFDGYRTLITSYAQFKQRFLCRFDSSDIQSQAIAKLYGVKQGPSEDTAVFITRKACLFNRIDPFKPESMKTRVIMDQLRPEIRSRLRGHPISSSEVLVAAATSVEKDLAEEQTSLIQLINSQNSRAPYSRGPGINQQNSCNRSYGSPTPQQQIAPRQAAPRVRFLEDRPRGTNFNGGSGNARAPDRPATPCRYCPNEQWHYHNVCPNNPNRFRREENPQGARDRGHGPSARSPAIRPAPAQGSSQEQQI